MDKQLVVSPAPHLKSPETIKSVMVDVLAALVPGCDCCCYLFWYSRSAHHGDNDPFRHADRSTNLT